MNFFIDTNVYLSFYHFTSDDLEELNKLAVLIANKQLTLYVPEQVSDEFQRNREVKISQALMHIKSQRLNLQFPQLCKDYVEYTKLREYQKKFEQAHSELLKKLNDDISTRSLKADKIIQKLFEQAYMISSSKELIEKAILRAETGKPPGKKNSIGDSIIWESLLSAVSDGDIFFVSDDNDYCSAIDDNRFSQYLENEWNKKKGTNLKFYKRLSQFFKETLPDIKLAGELEKEILIRQLSTSSNFSKTHSVLAKLRNHSGFTTDQLNAILTAYVSNNQIYWILSDPDVFSFIDGIVKENKGVLDPNNLTIFEGILSQIDSLPVIDTGDNENSPF